MRKGRFPFCCTCPDLAVGGCYPPPCPLEPGLSSRLAAVATRPATTRSAPQRSFYLTAGMQFNALRCPRPAPVQAALPCVAAFYFRVDCLLDRRLLKTPVRRDKIVGRGIARKSLHDTIRRESLENIDHHPDVLLPVDQRKGTGGELIGQGRVFDGVQVVEFDRIHPEPGHLVGRGVHLFFRLSREAEYDVGGDFKAAAPAPRDCIDHCRVRAAPVHPGERSIVHRLHSVFDRDIRLLGQFCQQFEHIVLDAVGPGADCQPDNPVMTERFFEKRSEPFGGGVGVCCGLEIGNEPFDPVPPLEILDSFVDLCRHIRPRHAAGWAVTTIVAKDAAADRDSTVHIRAGKTGIDAYFLDPLAESPPHGKPIGVVAEACLSPVVIFSESFVH